VRATRTGQGQTQPAQLVWITPFALAQPQGDEFEARTVRRTSASKIHFALVDRVAEFPAIQIEVQLHVEPDA
jgi:hypothetical protein